MYNPYSVLGVARDATEEEIKKAYKVLSRKYHPDANINNPNKAQAEEMFKSVQQAYDLIIKERQQGSGYGDFGYTYGNRNQNYDNSANSNELRAASNYIANGYYREAMTVLNGIDASLRSGTWYYYAAIASEGLGNIVDARTYIERAVSLEPSNLRFRQFLQHLDNGGMWYEARGSQFERPYATSGQWCVSMVLLNLFCNCCCI